MNVLFDESFEKSIKKLNDTKLKQKLLKLINDVETSGTLTELTNIKKMQGFKQYYRARIGDYRVGFELLNTSTILFILVAHRKDIYKVFP